VGSLKDEKDEIPFDLGPYCQLQKEGLRDVIQHFEGEDFAHKGLHLD
jgi:hypothetical protein